MGDDADPLKGWRIHDVMQQSLTAKHDKYGALYNHLRELLTIFCKRLQGLRINFFVYDTDPEYLIKSLKHLNIAQQSFDRIEVR